MTAQSSRAVRSLTRRVAWLTSLWAIAAAVVTASVVLVLHRQSVIRDFEAVLTAHLYTLVAGTGPGQGGVPDVESALGLGEARFDQPASGWYWIVEPIDGGASIRSPSLGDADIALPSDAPTFDDAYRRVYTLTGPTGSVLRAVETEIDLGEGMAARFRVFGNQSDVNGAIGRFARTLGLILGLLAVAGVLVNIAVVRFALSPLERARASLRDVSEGRADMLDDAVPREIEPLVDEMNALIAGNRRIIERARVQVGNLAHGLKTPLSVITNEARAVSGERGRTLLDQAQRMRTQVDTYLDRARIAAGSSTSLTDTDAVATVEGVLRAVRKLRPDRRIEFEHGGSVRFAGEAHDLEEIAGNLIENAAKWAHRFVMVRLAEHDADRLRLSVEDDGPGMDEAAAILAVQRGARLDETVEGSGLGLSIVRDIVREYGGAFELGVSEAGGLRATVLLPRKATRV